MKVIVSVVMLLLATLSTFVIPQKKDDKQPRPAAVSYSGCKLTKSTISGCGSKSNSGIQMGECWANTRIQNQKSAFFVPLEPGQGNYDSEGGPYGTCTAHDCYPKATDMSQTDNLANWCFFWAGDNSTDATSGKNKTSSDGGSMPKAPGEKAIPMPIVCPSTLKNCYSADWYEPGGKLAAYGNLVPTYKGIWFPLKDATTKKPLFCQGLGLGCATPTMRELQLQRLMKGTCDVSKCSNPNNQTKPKP